MFIAPGTLKEKSSEAFSQKRCHQGKLTLAGMQCQIPQTVCDIGNKKHFVCETRAGHSHKACDVTEGRGVHYHNYEISQQNNYMTCECLKGTDDKPAADKACSCNHTGRNRSKATVHF